MTQDDLILLLKKKQGDQSLREFAKELGVSAPYLSDIYKGRRLGGPKILGYFGLQRQTVTTVTATVPKKAQQTV